MQALWMVLAAFLFASMGACVKVASAHFNAAELVLYRGLIGMLLLWWLARSQGVRLATRYPAMHAWRSLVGVTALGAWFYAIAHLPLATAVTLNYMSSIWIAAFLVGGALLWGRTDRAAPAPGGGEGLGAQAPLVLTVLAGFAGVLLLLRPGLQASSAQQGFASVVGVLSGMAAALAYLQVVALSRLGEPETRTVFYFAVGSALAGAGALLLTGTSPWPGWGASAWLLPIGVLAAGGQLCMTRAYSRASSRQGTLVVASLQYCGVAFGALFGVLLFGERIAPAGWAGMALIVASGLVATALRGRAAPQAPAEEH